MVRKQKKCYLVLPFWFWEFEALEILLEKSLWRLVQPNVKH